MEKKTKRRIRIAVLLCILALICFFGCSSMERKLLFYPTHHPKTNGLEIWSADGQVIGLARPAKSPENVWLLCHGNGGQAADRAYALPCFPESDAVYILEYPGYGQRAGTPSKKSFDEAARKAYLALRQAYPDTPVCVAGESIGSGPASSLAGQDPPPDKIVLVVPFDKLSLVAKDHFPSFLVSLILRSDWDNVSALENYQGPIEIFGAEKDEIIAVSHAKALADALPGSKLFIIKGGHNEWSRKGAVEIRNP